MRTRLPPGPVALVAAALALLAVLFAKWTATSAWSFPRFLLALALLVYIPGRVLLDCARVRLRPLDHLTLALLLGLIASSLLYALTMWLGVPSLFLAGAGAAAVLCLRRARRGGRVPADDHAALDGAHWLLAGLILLAWGTLALLPHYYRNLSLSRHGELAYCHGPPDVALHLAFAHELTHAVPPEVPFCAGQRLSYHYGMDLVTALFSRHAGLSVHDLTVRFLPTLFFTLALLASFCFARAWLKSEYAAVLVAFLVVFGEDFSYLPGLWFRPEAWWCAAYFLVPTSLSLFWLNPMLPALALLFGGLFCLLRTFEDGGRAWLLLTALLFAVVLEVKVFVTLHMLLALGLAGLVCLARFRDARLLTSAAWTGLLILPLAWPMWRANQAGGGQTLTWHHSYLPVALQQLGMLDTRWARRILGVLEGDAVTVRGLTSLALVAVPGFLAGTLGMRLLALPALARAMLPATAASAPRLFLTLFVLLGPAVSMTCAVVDGSSPPEGQYNNAVWLFVQSKYVVWVFAVEMLLPLARRPRFGRLAAVAAAAGVIGLSVPSTVQFFQRTIAAQQTLLMPDRLSRSELEMVHFLRRASPAGEIVLARREPGLSLTALTPCRLPFSRQFDLHPFAPAEEFDQRRRDVERFWNGWARGEVRADVLERYHVAYVLLDKATEPGSAASWPTITGGQLLRVGFENDAFVVFRVTRALTKSEPLPVAPHQAPCPNAPSPQAGSRRPYHVSRSLDSD